MRRTRSQMKRSSPAPESCGEEPQIKKVATSLDLKPDDSSSESDIENYLKPAAEIDLNSSFFTTKITEKGTFEDIEKGIFSGINRLSESESEDDFTEKRQSDVSDHEPKLLANEYVDESTSKEQINKFERIRLYHDKIEEARQHIEIYKAKKSYKEHDIDIQEMLAVGESKPTIKIKNQQNLSVSVSSSEFETFSDSEKEDWEEINTEEKVLIPKSGVQITVELAGNVRKRKGPDLMDIIKRRLNRIKKENQVYIHKVHLLCWVAHGNYVNKILSSDNLMALVLSLLPSQKCYPSKRLTIQYLEEILQWYRKHVMMAKHTSESEEKLEDLLESQIVRKEAGNYKMFVYIFVCLLRSLGIRCRLMLSLQIEPLRPPTTELCSLSKVDGIDTKIKSTSSCSDKTSHKIKSTPSHSAKKTRTHKVLSSKKIKHINEKSCTELRNLKSKMKLRFEDMCSLESDDETKSKISTSQKRNSSKTKISNEKARAVQNKTKSGRDSASISSEKRKPTGTKRNTETASETPRIKKGILKSGTRYSGTNSTNAKKSENNAGQNSKQENNSNKLSDKKHLTLEIPKPKNTKQNSKNPMLSNIQVSSSENIKIGKKQTVSEIPLRRSRRLSKSPESPQIDASKTIQKIYGNKLLPDNEIHNDNSEATTSIELKKNSKKKSTTLKDAEIESEINSSRLLKFSRKSKNLKMTKKSENIPSVTVTTEKQSKDFIPQVDGGNDDSDSNSEKLKCKGNIKLSKLKTYNSNKCSLRERSRKLGKTLTYKEVNSDEDSRNTPIKNKFSLKKNTVKTGENSTALKIHGKLGCKSSDADGSRKSEFPVVGAMDIRNDIVNLLKKNMSEEKQLIRSKLTKHKQSSKYSDSDSDYMPEPIKKKPVEDDFKDKGVKVKRRIPMKKDLIEIEKQKQLVKEEEKKKKGINIWVEVFAEAEEKWISVDVTKGQIYCIKEIYTRATHPISYILAWDNENYIKDLTKRYCINWNTVTRKLRVDNKWLEKTLLPYKSPSNPRDREEDEELATMQLEQPLPTVISEYKNHPLYVLKRHLLKFEALYPPAPLILGFVRKEPVYSRECVHVLHSREIWLKDAKVVKRGEQPYKIVKARPKYDKLSNSIITDQPLEIFGKWQVEDYVPPTAENGVVPRNAYGNVELFKPTMIPKGTVHVQLPGLHKVARKMNIDCAPAIVGFDFHSGWSHPTFDGYIVCEEFSEQLIAGWCQEQEESEKRAQEKVEKRIYDNWRRLIRGLLIRERLKAKYDFGEPSTSKSNKTKTKRLVLKKRKVHSDSDSD